MTVTLDPARIPEELRHLLPLAERFGIADDWLREKVVREAKVEELEHLKKVVATSDDDLDKWLAGKEADSDSPSNEYVAFSAMRMAADYA
jgi:hypothetical protein